MIWQRIPREIVTDVLRMWPWPLLAIVLFALVFGTDLQDTNPGIQSSLYYIAQVTLRAYIGYWVARTALGKIDIGKVRFGRNADSIVFSARLIARAIIIAGVILTSK